MITLANPSSQFPFMHEMQAQSIDKISWIQRDTVPHSIVRKIFCRPPFSRPRRQFFRYPWVAKRAGKMWENNIYTRSRETPPFFRYPPAP